MSNPSNQPGENKGVDRNTKENPRPEGVSPAATPLEKDADRPERVNGGHHPSTVKNR